MGNLSPIRVCSEQDQLGKSLHSELTFKTIPTVKQPQSIGDTLTLKFLWSPEFIDEYEVPLTDKVLLDQGLPATSSGICKAPNDSGYYFSESSLKQLREKVGYQKEGAGYGMLIPFSMPLASMPFVYLEALHRFQQSLNAYHKVPANLLFDRYLPFLFKSGRVLGTLGVSSTLALLTVVPLETYTNYQAVKAGDRTTQEAVVDGVTDVGIGVVSGAVGIAAASKIGATLGTMVAPGLGTAIGFVAGCVIGYGVGYFLDEVKDQVS